MATIYKRKRDNRKKNAVYWIQYADHDGRRRTKKGFTDKRLTERLAAKLENDAMLQREGLIDPEEEQAAELKNTPLAEHLAAFERSLACRDNTPKHVRLTMSRVRRVINEAGMVTTADIDEESVAEVLAEITEDEGIGHRTHNHYVQSMDQFCRWLVKTKRVAANPLAGMQRLNAEVDIRTSRGCCGMVRPCRRRGSWHGTVTSG